MSKSYIYLTSKPCYHRLLNILKIALLMIMGTSLFFSCSNDDSSDANGIEASNPLTDAVKQIDHDMADLNFSELQPLGEAANLKTRGSDDESGVNKLVSELVDLLHGEKTVTVGGRRFSYQTFNAALSLSFDLAGYLKSQGTVSYTTNDGDLFTIAGTTEKDIYIKSWSINIEKSSELTIYKNDVQVLSLKSLQERNRPVWLPLLIRGNTFTGELAYHDYIVTLGYDREHTHQRSISLTYRKVGSDIPLIDMTTLLEDDANILNLIKHDVTVEADFNVKAMGGLLTLTGHSSNVNELVQKVKAITSCLEEGADDEQSCQQLANEFNDNLTLHLSLHDDELGNLLMVPQYVTEKGCWMPKLMIDLPKYGGRIVVSDLFTSLGIELPIFY